MDTFIPMHITKSGQAVELMGKIKNMPKNIRYQPPTYFWLRYYSECYPEHAWDGRTKYMETKRWAYTLSPEDLYFFRDKILEDCRTETSCVGPCFSVAVAIMTGRVDKGFSYMDFFQEAAIRDVMIQKFIDPCGTCYVCN